MYLEQLRIAGALSLALGIALISGAGVAGNEVTPQKSGFDKLVEAKFGDKVKVNDYSTMGAEYGGASKTANESATSAGAPKVNDYSNMGADYGESKKKSPAKTAAPETDTGAATDDTANASTDVLDVGYGKFNGNCSQCHGQDAVGSSFAPSLVKRLKGMDKAEFIEVVTNGKTVFNSSTGSYSVMPSWAENQQVMAHLNEIWAYLKARSDGKLGTGRPE